MWNIYTSLSCQDITEFLESLFMVKQIVSASWDVLLLKAGDKN